MNKPQIYGVKFLLDPLYLGSSDGVPTQRVGCLALATSNRDMQESRYTTLFCSVHLFLWALEIQISRDAPT